MSKNKPLSTCPHPSHSFGTPVAIGSLHGQSDDSRFFHAPDMKATQLPPTLALSEVSYLSRATGCHARRSPEPRFGTASSTTHLSAPRPGYLVSKGFYLPRRPPMVTMLRLPFALLLLFAVLMLVGVIQVTKAASRGWQELDLLALRLLVEGPQRETAIRNWEAIIQRRVRGKQQI